MQNAIILHNIRSAWNVGSIFRTSDALGISKIFLSGYTPTPTDRFGRVQKDIEKTALGPKNIPWEKIENITSLVAELKKKNFFLIAIEQDKNAIDYKKVKIEKPTVFIVGNEVDGISPDILKECNLIAEIPMNGKKESLNVSVAFGVAMFRMLDLK